MPPIGFFPDLLYILSFNEAAGYPAAASSCRIRRWARVCSRINRGETTTSGSSTIPDRLNLSSSGRARALTSGIFSQWFKSCSLNLKKIPSPYNSRAGNQSVSPTISGGTMVPLSLANPFNTRISLRRLTAVSWATAFTIFWGLDPCSRQRLLNSSVWCRVTKSSSSKRFGMGSVSAWYSFSRRIPGVICLPKNGYPLFI